jgi:hypothetical protein
MSDFTIALDDAIEFLIGSLDNTNRNFADFDYEFDLRHIIRKYLADSQGHSNFDYNGKPLQDLSPVFLDAAWELCRRGILRPSVKRLPSVNGLKTGQGFSLTQNGLKWIEQRRPYGFPIESSRFSQLIAEYEPLLGRAFCQRAIEAHKCYKSACYLGSCVMSGAAAESVLLTLASKRLGEAEAIKLYTSGKGTKKLKDGIMPHLSGKVSSDFQSLTSLISYWRNDAAHGEVSPIHELEAHSALVHLHRFAEYSKENWQQLTGVKE